MTVMRRTLVCFLLFSLALVSTNRGRAEGRWRAGVAKANITPSEPMWMSGYGGRDHVSEGKLTDLWAKALVLEDSKGQRVLLFSLDLVGISAELSGEVCAGLKKSHGLERSQIALCTSHTHTGPVVQGNLVPLHYMQVDRQQQKLVEQYGQRLVKQLVKIGGQAVDDLKPSDVGWGSGKATFAVNRRNNKEANVPQLREQGKLVGPVDHDAPVLTVKTGGKLRAIVFGYACHATVLSFYQWSGDYPGFAQMELEKRYPGATALFFAGCGADQNPLPRRKVELAKQYGKRLADAVARVIDGGTKSLVATVSSRYREIPLKLDAIPKKTQIEEDAKSSNRFVAARARMLLSQIAEGKPLPSTYPYPVQTWKLGDVQFVTLGGEVVVDFAVRLKSELQGVKTFVAGYTNDVMAYIASRRVLREGGYEGATAMIYYGLPTKWHASSEDDIVDEVHRQLDEQGKRPTPKKKP